MSDLPDPKMDNIDHIRIDLNATTRLGRLLPLLADVKVTHPKFGVFRTGQGLWEYLKISDTITKRDLENLRVASGFEAKKISGSYQARWNKALKDEIKVAMRSKIDDNIEIFLEFVRSELPFRYYHRLRNLKVIEPSETVWLAEWLCELRDELKKEVSKVQ